MTRILREPIVDYLDDLCALGAADLWGTTGDVVDAVRVEANEVGAATDDHSLVMITIA